MKDYDSVLNSNVSRERELFHSIHSIKSKSKKQTHKLFNAHGYSEGLFLERFKMFASHDFIPKCLKLSVFLVIILYWILGIFGAGVGLYVHYYQMLPIQGLIFVQFSPSFMFIVMGILLFIAATVGFVGALRENMYFIRWYLVILLFLLLAHIAMGVVAFVVLFSPPTVHVHTEEMLQNALITYNDDEQSAEFINKIQISVQCCGIGADGYKDWKLNPYFACSEDNFSAERCSVPSSCCHFDSMEKIDTTCGFGTTQNFKSQSEVSSIINTQGCVLKAEETVQDVAALLGFSAFGIATALICGIVLSSRMMNTLEMRVNEYWKEFNFESMMHYVPNSGIYYIPEPEHTLKATPEMEKFYR